MARIVYALILLAAGLTPSGARAETEAELVARAHAIHDRVLTVDTHVDIPPDFASDAYDPMGPDTRRQQVHVPSMVAGGMDAAFLIVFVAQGDRDTAGYARALSDAFVKFADIHKLTDKMYPDRIELATTAADVRRIHAAGKRVALIGMENGYPMGQDLRLLDIFYDYGARYFGLVHVGHNDLGRSSLPNKKRNEIEDDSQGLTPLGRKVVERLNQLGIMVDVSHSSHRTSLDILAAAKAPVIASHSGVRGVYDHPRNLSDEELLAIKKSGGVAQIVAYDTYLRASPQDKVAAVAALAKEFGLESAADYAKLTPQQQADYDSRMSKLDATWPKAGVKDLVDHIDYAVKKVGIDTVGIASDFNGGGGLSDWSNAGETFNVTLELVRRGYSEEDIAKLWGGNLLRVMERVEDYAARWKKHHHA
jgi:membrane dipeptidase